MPENDFEKQVQRLFGELRIKPSEKVWPQVESRVKKDKNRRRFFLWLPAALIALIAGGYWVIQMDPAPAAISEQHTPAIKQNLHQTHDKAETNPTAGGQPGAAVTKEDGSSGTVNAPGDAIPGGKALTDFEKPGGNATEPGVTAASNTQQQKTPGVIPRQVTGSGSDQTVRGTKSIQNTAPDLPPAVTGQHNEPQPPVTGPADQTVTNNIYTQLEGTLQKIDKRSFPALATQHTLQGFEGNAPQVKIPKPKVWEWGLSAGSGVSALDNGSLSDALSFEKRMERADALPQLDFNSVSGNYGQMLAPQAIPLYAVAPPASSVRRDFSWYGGAFVKRKLNDRFSLSSGLQYHQYTTNRIVGDVSYQNNAIANMSNASNNSIARYSGTYRTGRKYTNRYHFIEMPLGIDWRVFNSRIAPVYINAGVQLSYLVATNALHYDVKSGVYYEDRDYFRKLQTGFYAGVSTRLFSQKPYAFNIGPVFSYQASNLTKPAVNTKQNLMFVGMNLQWVMGSR